jgi:hypothetical protein
MSEISPLRQIRERVRAKLVEGALGPIEDSDVTFICRMLYIFSADQDAIDLRATAFAHGADDPDSHLAWLSETFAEELALLNEVSLRLLKECLAHGELFERYRGVYPEEAIRQWYNAQIDREFLAIEEGSA